MRNNYKINEKPPIFAYNDNLYQKRKIALPKNKALKTQFRTVLVDAMQKELKKHDF